MNEIIVIGFVAIIALIAYNMLTKKESVADASSDALKDIQAAAPAVEKAVETVATAITEVAPAVEKAVEAVTPIVEQVANTITVAVENAVASANTIKLSEIVNKVEVKAEEAITEVVAKVKKPRKKKAAE